MTPEENEELEALGELQAERDAEEIHGLDEIDEEGFNIKGNQDL